MIGKGWDGCCLASGWTIRARTSCLLSVLGLRHVLEQRVLLGHQNCVCSVPESAGHDRDHLGGARRPKGRSELLMPQLQTYRVLTAQRPQRAGGRSRPRPASVCSVANPSGYGSRTTPLSQQGTHSRIEAVGVAHEPMAPCVSEAQARGCASFMHAARLDGSSSALSCFGAQAQRCFFERCHRQCHAWPSEARMERRLRALAPGPTASP